MYVNAQTCGVQSCAEIRTIMDVSDPLCFACILLRFCWCDSTQET